MTHELAHAPIEQPSLDTFSALCAAPEVRVLCVTGGPMVVAAASANGVLRCPHSNTSVCRRAAMTT